MDSKFVKWRVNANHILWLNISILIGMLSSRMICPQGIRTLWLVWWVWKWFKSCTVAYIIYRSQHSWILMGDFGVLLDCTLYHRNQNTNWGNMVFKNGFFGSSTIPESYTFCSSGLLCTNTFLRHFMLKFFMLKTSCSRETGCFRQISFLHNELIVVKTWHSFHGFPEFQGCRWALFL